MLIFHNIYNDVRKQYVYVTCMIAFYFPSLCLLILSLSVFRSPFHLQKIYLIIPNCMWVFFLFLSFILWVSNTSYMIIKLMIIFRLIFLRHSTESPLTECLLSRVTLTLHAPDCVTRQKLLIYLHLTYVTHYHSKECLFHSAIHTTSIVLPSLGSHEEAVPGHLIDNKICSYSSLLSKIVYNWHISSAYSPVNFYSSLYCMFPCTM